MDTERNKGWKEWVNQNFRINLFAEHTSTQS
jgi:hypothetical protein